MAHINSHTLDMVIRLTSAIAIHVNENGQPTGAYPDAIEQCIGALKHELQDLDLDVTNILRLIIKSTRLVHEAVCKKPTKSSSNTPSSTAARKRSREDLTINPESTGTPQKTKDDTSASVCSSVENTEMLSESRSEMEASSSGAAKRVENREIPPHVERKRYHEENDRKILVDALRACYPDIPIKAEVGVEDMLETIKEMKPLGREAKFKAKNINTCMANGGIVRKHESESDDDVIIIPSEDSDVEYVEGQPFKWQARRSKRKRRTRNSRS